jgi:hypothetical protein
MLSLMVRNFDEIDWIVPCWSCTCISPRDTGMLQLPSRPSSALARRYRVFALYHHTSRSCTAFSPFNEPTMLHPLYSCACTLLAKLVSATAFLSELQKPMDRPAPSPLPNGLPTSPLTFAHLTSNGVAFLLPLLVACVEIRHP